MTACPWTILGVPAGSDKERCRQAFRRLTQEHHPDLGGSEEAQAAINEAWAAIQSGSAALRRAASKPCRESAAQRTERIWRDLEEAERQRLEYLAGFIPPPLHGPFLTFRHGTALVEAVLARLEHLHPHEEPLSKMTGSDYIPYELSNLKDLAFLLLAGLTQRDRWPGGLAELEPHWGSAWKAAMSSLVGLKLVELTRLHTECDTWRWPAQVTPAGWWLLRSRKAVERLQGLKLPESSCPT